jgi:hypothetical protein
MNFLFDFDFISIRTKGPFDITFFYVRPGPLSSFLFSYRLVIFSPNHNLSPAQITFFLSLFASPLILFFFSVPFPSDSGLNQMA